MGKLRPYLALDLETTGLDVKNVQILQIGWVIDDGVSPRAQLKSGSVFIKNPLITHGEPFAMGMNAWIFAEMNKKPELQKYPTLPLAAGLWRLACAIQEAIELAKKWDSENGLKPRGKIQVSGKNPGNFDWPIVMNNLSRGISELGLMNDAFTFEDIAKIFASVDHRFIDVGGVFFPQFGRNAGFDEISKLVGMPPINHDALDDAMACVIANRYSVGMKE